MPCEKSLSSPGAVAKLQSRLRGLARGRAKQRRVREIHARANTCGVENSAPSLDSFTRTTCPSSVKDEEVDVELPSESRNASDHVPEPPTTRPTLEYINQELDAILRTLDNMHNQHTNLKKEEAEPQEVGELGKVNGPAPVKEEEHESKVLGTGVPYEPSSLVPDGSAPPNIPSPSHALAPPDANSLTRVYLPENPGTPGGPFVCRLVPSRVAARGLQATRAWAEEIDRRATAQGKALPWRRLVWITDREPEKNAPAPPRNETAAEVPSGATNSTQQTGHPTTSFTVHKQNIMARDAQGRQVIATRRRMHFRTTSRDPHVHRMLARIAGSGIAPEYINQVGNSLHFDAGVGAPANGPANPALPHPNVDNYQVQAQGMTALGQPMYHGYQHNVLPSAYSAAVNGQGAPEAAYNNNALMHEFNPGLGGSGGLGGGAAR